MLHFYLHFSLRILVFYGFLAYICTKIVPKLILTLILPYDTKSALK